MLRDDERRRALRAFLLQARRRVDPAAAGLRWYGRRRTRGLRREEVAELAQISVAWYTRFETGVAQVSLNALERIGDALRLSGDERSELARLARPELDRLARGDVRSSLGAAAAIARRMWSATTDEEVVGIAASALHDACGERYDAWGCLVLPGALLFTTAAGRSAWYLEGLREEQQHPGWDHAVRARISICPDFRWIDTDEMRERRDRIGVQSYAAAQIAAGGRCRAMFGIASTELGIPDRAVLDAIDVLQRLASAALSTSGDAPQGWAIVESPSDEVLVLPDAS